MKMRRLSAMAVLSLAALLASCQYGGASMPVLADGVPHTFLALDEDRDGGISRAEASVAPVLERRFELADANADGLLDRYEFNSPEWRPFPDQPD